MAWGRFLFFYFAISLDNTSSFTIARQSSICIFLFIVLYFPVEVMKDVSSDTLNDTTGDFMPSFTRKEELAIEEEIGRQFTMCVLMNAMIDKVNGQTAPNCLAKTSISGETLRMQTELPGVLVAINRDLYLEPRLLVAKAVPANTVVEVPLEENTGTVFVLWLPPDMSVGYSDLVQLLERAQEVWIEAVCWDKVSPPLPSVNSTAD